MSHEVKTIEAAEEWDDFVTSHPEANFLQSWQWGEFHLSRGRKIMRRGVFSGEKLIGVYTGHIEPARRGKHMQIPGGPIVDWSDDEAVKMLFADMREQAAQAGCIYVRVRPQREDSPASRETLANNGLKPAPMYLSVELAGVLDLTKSEDEILAGMRQRLRRALRKAEKNNITVETSTNPADIHEFYQIQLQTAGTSPVRGV